MSQTCTRTSGRRGETRGGAGKDGASCDHNPVISAARGGADDVSKLWRRFSLMSCDWPDQHICTCTRRACVGSPPSLLSTCVFRVLCHLSLSFPLFYLRSLPPPALICLFHLLPLFFFSGSLPTWGNGGGRRFFKLQRHRQWKNQSGEIDGFNSVAWTDTLVCVE